MSASFKDVTIVDLDVSKTTWSRVHSSMRTLYLKLSRDPDQAWTRFFSRNARRASSSSGTGCGSKKVISCSTAC